MSEFSKTPDITSLAFSLVIVTCLLESSSNRLISNFLFLPIFFNTFSYSLEHSQADTFKAVLPGPAFADPGCDPFTLGKCTLVKLPTLTLDGLNRVGVLASIKPVDSF